MDPRFHRRLRSLKDLRRSGWLQREVPEPESVADHSHAVAVLGALVARERGLDAGRAALLGLVHDLPEALCGDPVPGEVPQALKRERERAAIVRLDAEAGAQGWLVGLWEEFEEGTSPEARLLRALDKAEAGLQALGYHAAGRGRGEELLGLAHNARTRVSDAEVLGWLEVGDGEGPPGRRDASTSPESEDMDVAGAARGAGDAGE